MTVRFVIFAPRKEAGHSIWVTGGPQEMGKWSDDNKVPMVHIGRGIFVGQVGGLFLPITVCLPFCSIILFPLP